MNKKELLNKIPSKRRKNEILDVDARGVFYNPKKCSIPKDQTILMALFVEIALKIHKANIHKVWCFLPRLPERQQFLLMRVIVMRDRNSWVIDSSDFIEWCMKNIDNLF